MAVSVYDDMFLDEEQKEKLRRLTEEWEKANQAGDQAWMDSAHAAAERIRASANYQGGENGGQFLPLGNASGGGYGSGGYGSGWYGSGWYGSGGSVPGMVYGEVYTASDLPEYRAQTEAVNELYDAAQKRKLAQLRTAFDENMAALEAEKAAIPGIYQSGRNEASAQSELAGRNFKEYAAASGLASGAAGQAELARSNQLQGELGRLNAQESAAQEDILREQTGLRTRYANDVADAIAQGEFERAAALLEEYRRAEESHVSTARDQADENYRAYDSRASAAAEAEKRRAESAQAEAQWRLDAAKAQTQREAEAAKAQAQREADAAKASASESEAKRKALEERAERLASFGDFSGYADLGYTQEEVDRMRRAWISKNPLTAYYTGAITREEYLALTGKE